jgi:hypothetical protein
LNGSAGGSRSTRSATSTVIAVGGYADASGKRSLGIWTAAGASSARRGGRRFFLIQEGIRVATAERERRNRWTVLVGDLAYELRPTSVWRSQMELRRGEVLVGSIRRVRGNAPRSKTVCDLPPELSLAVQAFIGLVVMMLWNRAAEHAGATSPVLTGSGA